MTRVVAVLLLLTTLLPACSQPETLMVYSGRSENLVGPLLTRFSRDTGIEVDIRYDETANLALLIEEEGEASPADVFLSQSPGATGLLLLADRLRPLPAELVAQVPPAFRGPEGKSVGVTARQRVLVFNQDEIAAEDLPASVMDIVDPEFAGRVAVAPTNASFLDFVTAMRQAEGEAATQAWLDALGEQDAPTYENNNAIVEAVSRGEIAMGLVNHYYNARFLAEDASLPSRNHVFASGDVGAAILESAAAVVDSTDRPEDAEAFIAYLLQPQAQQYFAEETFEYPLVAGVEPVGDLPPLDIEGAPVIDLAALGADLERTSEMVSSSGLTQ